MDKPVTALTQGCHHIGLSVSHLEKTADFFKTYLGWQEVRRDLDYPAIFISDNSIMLTLWGVKQNFTPFDKNYNVGLHHLALTVDCEEKLFTIYTAIQADDSIRIEFAPEFLRQGPAKHMMFYEPSGIRLEIIWPGNSLKK